MPAPVRRSFLDCILMLRRTFRPGRNGTAICRDVGKGTEKATVSGRRSRTQMSTQLRHHPRLLRKPRRARQRDPQRLRHIQTRCQRLPKGEHGGSQLPKQSKRIGSPHRDAGIQRSKRSEMIKLSLTGSANIARRSRSQGDQGLCPSARPLRAPAPEAGAESRSHQRRYQILCEARQTIHSMLRLFVAGLR